MLAWNFSMEKKIGTLKISLMMKLKQVEAQNKLVSFFPLNNLIYNCFVTRTCLNSKRIQENIFLLRLINKQRLKNHVNLSFWCPLFHLPLWIFVQKLLRLNPKGRRKIRLRINSQMVWKDRECLVTKKITGKRKPFISVVNDFLWTWKMYSNYTYFEIYEENHNSKVN